MPKLPRLPAAEVVAALKRLGFEEVRQKGSHLVLRRTSSNADGTPASVICVVPLHRRRHLHRGPLNSARHDEASGTEMMRIGQERLRVDL